MYNIYTTLSPTSSDSVQHWIKVIQMFCVFLLVVTRETVIHGSAAVYTQHNCFSITQIIIHSAVKAFYRVPKFETVKDKFTFFHPDNEEDLLITILFAIR